jgi:hypothetical protein
MRKAREEGTVNLQSMANRLKRNGNAQPRMLKLLDDQSVGIVASTATRPLELHALMSKFSLDEGSLSKKHPLIHRIVHHFHANDSWYQNSESVKVFLALAHRCLK